VYRAKQRGHLELDLLLGKYAEEKVPQMDMKQLVQTEKLLSEENPDMWMWLTHQQPAPEHVQNNPIFKVLRVNRANRCGAPMITLSG
jgi:succinate dehydrogenase flavin-adding protein (antitoxin of CptAB toxin-antitoxin module)